MSEAKDELDGTVVKRTSDQRPYTIDTSGEQLSLVPESDSQQEVTIAAGQLRLALKGGTYYTPMEDDDQTEVVELLSEVQSS